MKPKLVRTVLVLSVLLNVVLLSRLLPLDTGGGKIVSSPDGKFVAAAMSQKNNNPFASRNVIGEFRVMTQPDHRDMVLLTVQPTVQAHYMAYRQCARIVCGRRCENAVIQPV